MERPRKAARRGRFLKYANSLTSPAIQRITARSRKRLSALIRNNGPHLTNKFCFAMDWEASSAGPIVSPWIDIFFLHGFGNQCILHSKALLGLQIANFSIIPQDADYRANPRFSFLITYVFDL